MGPLFRRHSCLGYINVDVNALTGKITRFECSWNEPLPAPEKTVSMEDITERAISSAGFYPLYVEDNSGSNTLPKGKLVYALNSSFLQFDPVSGNPVTYYGVKKSWADVKTYSLEFTPVPAPEKNTIVSLSGTRKSLEEAETIAAEFFEKLGIEGRVKRSGGRMGDELPYPVEHWRFCPAETYNSPWEEAEVFIDTATGKVMGFSRTPKKEKFIFPGLELSRAEAQKAALDFLAAINENTDNMVLQAENKYHSVPGMKQTTHDFTWVRLVNGVPFPADNLRVSISRSTGRSP